MKVLVTYTVQVEYDDEKVNGSDVEKSLQTTAEKYGSNVDVEEYEVEELDDDTE